MEAKEEAKKIVEDFLRPTAVFNQNKKWVPNILMAKKCAIYLANYNIKTLESLPINFDPRKSVQENIFYWRRTKEEIHRLPLELYSPEQFKWPNMMAREYANQIVKLENEERASSR